MTRVQKIAREIEGLSRKDQHALRRWFLGFDSDAWDREFEADVKAGKLDSLAEEALEEHRSGKSKRI